jgi:hypothetical protein
MRKGRLHGAADRRLIDEIHLEWQKALALRPERTRQIRLRA